MGAPHGSIWRKGLMAIEQDCYELYGTNPGGSILQNSSCTATYHSFRKPSKSDEQGMRDTAGEVRTNSLALLRTPSHGRARVGGPARTYLQQLYTDTVCCMEDLPGAMDDRDEWRERFREIRARGTTG